jgi:hypothetical protein
MSMSAYMAERSMEGMLPDADGKVKKTRASKPKVKTGCQTCKFVIGFL